MEKQYIGARYVPILGGAWDNQKSYEALTIVQANNNSYTSKKPVPPGIDITNTEYWVITGNFNGQVEEYRQEVVQLSARVDQVEQDSTAAEENLQNQIDELKTGVGASVNLKNANCLAIGDSYARGTGGTVGRGVFYYLENYFAEFTGYANGGAGYLTPGNSGSGDFPNKTFVEELSDIAAQMEEETRKKIQYVFCEGGLNDRDQTFTELESAVETFITTARANFPNAKVVCICPWCDSPFTAAKYYNSLATIEKAAAANGALICSHAKFWFIGYTQYGAGDSIHLNETGYRIMAGYMAAVMSGWDGVIADYWGVGDEVPETVTPSYRISRIDEFVELSGNFKTTFDGENSPTLVTLGTIYRPYKTFYAFGWAYSTSDNKQVVLEYQTSGILRLAPAYARQLTGEYTIYANNGWIVGI